MILLPVGHEQTTVRRLPWVTFVIMALCILSLLFSGQSSTTVIGPGDTTGMTGFRTDTLSRWGLVPAQSAPLTLLTYMFLHVGWVHLIGNLLILYLAGPFIEDVWGRPLFVAFYLAAGLTAAAFHVAADPGSTSPMVGASGAIAGVMGAFLVRYGGTRVRFFYLIMLVVRGTFSTPAWVLLPLWFAHQLALAVIDSTGGVAYWAHVGGFTTGVLGALLIRGFDAERRWVEPALRDKIDTPLLDNALVERGLAVRADGNVAQAISRLRHAVEREPANPDAAGALWSVALEHGRATQVGPLLLRSIAAQLRAGETSWALDLWGEILENAPDVSPDTALLLWIGRLLAEDGRNRAARVTLQKALQQHGPQTPPAFALRLARTAQVLDPLLALSAVERALADPTLDPGSRREAVALREALAPTEILVTDS